MKTFHKAPIALAVTALMVAPVAFAQEDSFDALSSIESTFMNSINVDLSHTSDTQKTFRIDVRVTDRPDHYSGALVDSKQFTAGNEVDNIDSDNNATVGSGTGSGATGNVGINVAAGENNAQANDAALAASDARDIFGQSEAYSAQDSRGNTVTNTASTNNARLGSDSLQYASGNIGVNVAAGTSNAQQNSLAASANENSNGSARATTGGVQQTAGNTTINTPQTELGEGIAITLEGSMEGGYLGGGLGSYEGGWKQTNDVYPEIWQDGGEGADSNHKIGGGSTYWGHADFDDDSNSGQPGRFEGEQSGELGFIEAGALAMGGTFSGNVTTTTIINSANDNNAVIGSNALVGSSGNVGVNVVAGSNNLQRNSLSIASSTRAVSSGNGPE